MKYYHGSKSNFTVFNRKGSGKHGEGFYFTPDKAEANYFARSLYGGGGIEAPTIYTVNLKLNRSFNSMNPEDCESVMRSQGLKYSVAKNAGGAKEHYHYLEKQLKKNGILKSVNEVIQEAGFDSIVYDFMGHVIWFNEAQIEILESEILD